MGKTVPESSNIEVLPEVPGVEAVRLEGPGKLSFWCVSRLYSRARVVIGLQFLRSAGSSSGYKITFLSMVKPLQSKYRFKVNVPKMIVG